VPAPFFRAGTALRRGEPSVVFGGRHDTSGPRPGAIPLITECTAGPEGRVSTLELFFDLVFVFTITQVTHLVAHSHGATDLARAFLLLAVTRWMYGGYAWLTNNIGTRDTLVRVLLVCAMAAFLVMALAIPGVAGRDGVAFGIAYLVIVLLHLAMFVHAPNASARAIFRVVPYNLAGAGLVIAAGYATGALNLALWVASLATLLATGLVRAERGFSLHPGHFAERHGLVVIIALGESVIALGTGAGAVTGPARSPSGACSAWVRSACGWRPRRC
jgi:low temperature requirement protein LtrA